MTKIKKSEVREVIEIIREKLSRDTEAACGVFYADEPPVYILPPDEPGDDEPIYIMPPQE